MISFYWLLIAIAAMCAFMAICVVFDSKTWEHSERGGLFIFHHKWVSILCVPMLFLVPICVFFYALFVPLDVSSIFVRFICRVLIFMGLFAGSMFVFVVFSTLSLGAKALLKGKI